jgi:hypothetical protein
VTMANAVKYIQRGRKCDSHANQEAKREYPAEVFPKAMYEYGDSFQGRQSLTAICVAVQRTRALRRWR